MLWPVITGHASPRGCSGRDLSVLRHGFLFWIERSAKQERIRLYGEAAEVPNDPDGKCFYLTHTYIFALEAGQPKHEGCMPASRRKATKPEYADIGSKDPRPGEGLFHVRGLILSQIPSRPRTVRCATGMAGRSVTVSNRYARTSSASSNGPSIMANPAPGQTRCPAENGI